MRPQQPGKTAAGCFTAGGAAGLQHARFALQAPASLCFPVPTCARGMPPPLQSYYGAALCVCWSPDGAFVASGGEDDLVATYSVAERQVRGQHRLQRILWRLCNLCPRQLSASLYQTAHSSSNFSCIPPCWWKLSSCHGGPAKILRANPYAVVCCAAVRWLLSVRVTTAG